MNDTEKLFTQSIKNKIKNFKIKTTLKEAIGHGTNQFAETIYSNNNKEIVDIGIEFFLCSISPLYFISQYAWIKLPNVGIIPYDLYYFQKEILLILNDYLKIVFNKVRQCGISTVVSLYLFWRGLFHEAEYVEVVSTKQRKAKSFVEKMRPTIERLPFFLLTKIFPDNQQELGFQNGSSIISETQSENAGRSDSLSSLVLDEVAHYKSDKMVRNIISSAEPTLSKTGGQIFLISTPCGVVGPGAYYHEQVKQLETEEEDSAKLINIDWWEVPDDDRIPGPKKGYNDKLNEIIKLGYFNNLSVRREAKKFFKSVEDNYKNNAWLKHEFQTLGPVIFRQEILHDFIISGNPVLSVDSLDRIEAEIKEPIIKDKLGNRAIKNLWIWKPPIPGHRYGIGVDVSTGTGRESSSIQIFDIDEYEQVAEFKGMISTKLLGKLTVKIAKYYNEGYIIIESNGIGEATFNEVYYNDNEPYRIVYKQKKVKNGIIRMTGWITDVKTRQLITNEFIDWLENDQLWDQLKIYSSRLYGELTTWVWSGNKPTHSSGATDDAIMAFSIVLYNRNKVQNTGESFLINEDGNLVEYEKGKDKNDEEEVDLLDVLFDDSNEDKKQFFGMSKEDYKWLIS